MEDKEILIRLTQGDDKAFECLFRKYFHLLNEYALFYVSDWQLAEDIVQDQFYKIWKGREELSIRSSVKAYLIRSVHNSCIQYLRHLRVVTNHTEFIRARYNESQSISRLYFENGLTKLYDKEIDSLVEEAIKGMPHKTREIYLLSRTKQYSNSEIADETNLSGKSVEYHITSALRILRQYLKDYLPVVFLLFCTCE